MSFPRKRESVSLPNLHGYDSCLRRNDNGGYNDTWMKPVILLNKPLGMTPLQAIWEFKKQNPEYKEAKIGYAGRLDPMAEGLLLLLVGEENKKRKEYENLPKVYEFSLLLGVSTDTYDLLGLVTKIGRKSEVKSRKLNSLGPRTSDLKPLDFIKDNLALTEKVAAVLPTFLGKQTLPYPPYSSRTVNGIPLYKYARENRLHEIEIPTRNVEIFSLELLPSSLLSRSALLSYISRVIPEIHGNFRQAEILQKWHATSPYLPTHLPHLSFRLTCSSGTYVRGIVHELEIKIGIPTVTYAIKRTQIGEFRLKDAEKSQDETNNHS